MDGFGGSVCWYNGLGLVCKLVDRVGLGEEKRDPCPSLGAPRARQLCTPLTCVRKKWNCTSVITLGSKKRPLSISGITLSQIHKFEQLWVC